jgi:hypothetical protein
MVGMSRWIVLASFVASMSLSAPALGAPSTPSTPSTNEVASEKADLLAQIQKDYDSLSTNDCAIACRALASMERAKNRLCAIDPGPACDDARAKVEDARKRVRAACPMCAEPPREEAPTTPARAPDVGATAPAPQAERTRGGCASCATTSGRADLGSALTVLAAAGLLFGQTRRRRRR